MRRGLLSLLLVFPWVTSHVRGYAGDTHYYLRFAEALETCFDWDEAHLIASADYLVDKNKTTTAEKHPFKKYNKIHWHAFGRDEERFNELWERVLAESDPDLQLVKLGQFLHYISDWESHFGYGVRLGHGIGTFAGRDPDSLGANQMNNLRMIDQTVDHMIAVCVARGDWQGDRDRFRARLYKDLAQERLLEEMLLYNSRKWKSWGIRGKKGKEIMAKNRLLIEQLIQKRAEGHPERGVPSDFTPGEKGLPPPIGLRYLQDGTLVEVYGVEIELLPEYEGDPYGAAEEDVLEESLDTEVVDNLEADLGEANAPDLESNLEMQVLDADLGENSWVVTVKVSNLGGGTSPEGQVEIVVLDVATEELLGEATRPIRALGGRESLRMDVVVDAPGRASRGILIGATVNADDLSADNNSAWFVPWREGLEADPGKSMKEARENLAVEIYGGPRMWVDESGEEAWVVIQAHVAGGHSSRRLQTIGLTLGSESQSVAVNVNAGLPAVWASIPDLKRRVVPGETLAWFPIDADLCVALRDSSIRPGQLTIQLEGSEILTTTGTYPLDETFQAALGEACRRKVAASPHA